MKRYDIEYSTEIVQDHTTWAKPFSNGSMNVLFVPSVKYGREIVECIQRMDIEYETVTIDRAWDLNKWGLGDYYHKRGGIWDFEVMYQNLENVLTSDQVFDCMVIPGLNGWSSFTEKTRQAILRRVEAGAGLVLIRPLHGEGQPRSAELDRLSPLHALSEEGLSPKGYPKISYDVLENDSWIADNHYITSGIPFDCFPFEQLAYYPYQADGDVIIRSESGGPIAAIKKVGQGRVVAFGYFPRDILPQLKEHRISDCFDSNLEKWKGADHGLPFNYLEYGYGLIGRSIIWAAGRDPAPVLTGIHFEPGVIRAEAAESQPGDRYRYRVRNPYDEIVFESETENLYTALPDSIQEAGGLFRAETYLLRDGKVVDWYVQTLRLASNDAIAGLILDGQLVPAGGTLSGKAMLNAGTGTLKIGIMDDFGKEIHLEERQVVGEKEIPFAFRMDHIQSLHVRVVAEWSKDNVVLSRAQSDVVTIALGDRVIRDFEMYMTPLNRGQGDMLSLQTRRARELGVTGLFPGSPVMTTTTGVKGMGTYWYNRKEYTERKNDYLRTRDKTLLRRDPCLNDPDFWKKTRNVIRDNVRKDKKYGPVAYFANDEGSLTCYSDEHDLCHCPHCMDRMRGWLQGRYRDLEQLNKDWGSAFAAWDEVAPYTTLEAKESGRYESWSEHRLFMEQTFADAFRQIGEEIRAEDPAGRVRVSGVQASTPFNGYDYYEVLRNVDFIEAYRVGNQYEFHRSFVRTGTTIGAWAGYGMKGNFVKHFIWNGLFHGLTLMSLFWEPSIINPDGTFSQSGEDIGSTVKEIRREGIGKLLLYGAKRDNLGIAIHYSMPSARAAYIRSDYKRFERNRAGWLQALEDTGYQYTFVATQQIEAGELLKQGYKVLIMPYSAALGEKESAEIRKFVENGGAIVGDMQTGIMNARCQYEPNGQLDDLFGISRYTFEAVPFFGDDKVSVNKSFSKREVQGTVASQSLGWQLVENGIRSEAGEAYYLDEFMARIAGVVLNEGPGHRGKGAYLNGCLSEYAEQRGQDRGVSIRAVLDMVLTWSGVVRPAKLVKTNGEPAGNGYETFYYNQDAAAYVAVLRDSDCISSVGYDGVETYEDNPSPLPPEAVCFKLESASYVYDIRRRSYLGYIDSIDTELAPGEASLYSLLPCKLDGISLELDGKVRLGGELRVDVRLKHGAVDADKAVPDSVCCFSVYDPDGNYCPSYASNEVVAAEGSLVWTRHIPYNETTGIWKLVVKDAATGISEERNFELI